MQDLISRQAAIDAVYKCSDIFAGDMPVMVVKADAYEALAQLPSADVVPMERYKSMENTCVKLQKSLADVAPVVRCKDCKHGRKSQHQDGNNPYWVCLNWDSGTDEDGYCHHGERKDDDKSCDTCKHYDKGWDDAICDGCTTADSRWERKDDE